MNLLKCFWAISKQKTDSFSLFSCQILVSKTRKRPFLSVFSTFWFTFGPYFDFFKLPKHTQAFQAFKSDHFWPSNLKKRTRFHFSSQISNFHVKFWSQRPENARFSSVFSTSVSSLGPKMTFNIGRTLKEG